MTRNIFLPVASLMLAFCSLAAAQQPFTAPALDLSLPRAVALRFPGSPGMDYRLEFSDDFKQWTRTAVSASELSPGVFEAFDAAGHGKT